MCHAQRVLHAAAVNDPFAMQVEFTSRCNLACPGCPLTSEGTASSARPGHMSNDVWSAVLAVARSTGHIYVAGFGEPLTHPRCLDMLADLDEARLSTTFVTNGIGLSQRRAVGLLALPSLVHLNVSVDSPDPQVFALVRGGRLEHALRGLEALMASGADPARISVSTLLGRDNAASLVAMPELLARVGVRNWVVQGLVDYNEHSQTQRLRGDAATRSLVEELRCESQRHGIAVTLTAPDRLDLELTDANVAHRRFFAVIPPAEPSPSPSNQQRPSRQCLVPWELPYVDKDGAVHACCFAAGHGDAPLGDLAQQSFNEVWLGPQYQSVRRSLITGQALRPSCLACTSVSWGPHPLASLSAVPLGAPHVAGGVATLRYRNTGGRPWTRQDRVRLGTAFPRDGVSPLGKPEWLRPNRPTSHREDCVPVEGTATFTFSVAAQRAVVEQHLELVADGTCWLPGTRVVLVVEPDAGRPASRLDRVCKTVQWLELGNRARSLKRRVGVVLNRSAVRDR